jgi:UDP-glucuronate 4-epimerase
MAFHRFCRAMLRGEAITVYGDGAQSRDFTFVPDAVEATFLAWERGGGPATYNVGGGSQVEVREVIALLERLLGVKAIVRHEPTPPGDPLRTRADSTRLRAALGMVPSIGIEQGLAAEAEWARRLYGEGRR